MSAIPTTIVALDDPAQALAEQARDRRACVALVHQFRAHLAAMNYHSGEAEKIEDEINLKLATLPEADRQTIEAVLDGAPAHLLHELERTVRA